LKAKIISFEGGDGLGKSTQAKIIAENLRSQGKRVACVKLPAYDRLTGKLIRKMLKSGTAVTFPNVFQIFQWLDKIIFQLFYMRALLKSNDYVLFDRWHVSMWAYGLAGGADEKMTNMLIDTLVKPDITFVFHGKSKREEKTDFYESDALYQKSVALYYILWTCWNDSAKEIYADQSIQLVSDTIIQHINCLKEKS
jgi:thymidylate kinase